MSYCIVKVKKFRATAVKGIEIHDLRKKNNCTTNKDIDKSMSIYNYDLHGNVTDNYSKFIKNRIQQLQLKKAVRRDAVAMVQVMVTSDNEYFKRVSEDQRKEFFKDSYNYLCNKYGKENVVSSIVHLDETTPHMHFNFVPVTKDNRLCAKDIINLKNLLELQTEFFQVVGKKHNLKRGRTKEERLRDGDIYKNMSMPEYKAYTFKLKELRDKIKPLRIEYEAKKTFIDEVNKSSESTNLYPEYAKRKKNIFGKEVVIVPKDKWEERYISANEKSLLGKLRNYMEKTLEKLCDEPFYANERFEEVKKKNEILNNKIYDLIKENKDLKVENTVYKKFEKKANNVIKSLTKEDLELFNQYSEIQKEKINGINKDDDDNKNSR